MILIMIFAIRKQPRAEYRVWAGIEISFCFFSSLLNTNTESSEPALPAHEPHQHGVGNQEFYVPWIIWYKCFLALSPLK